MAGIPTLFVTDRVPIHQQKALEAAPDGLEITMMESPEREAVLAALADDGTTLGSFNGFTVEGVHDGVVVSRTWLACDQTPGTLIAVSTSGGSDASHRVPGSGTTVPRDLDQTRSAFVMFGVVSTPSRSAGERHIS